jgi:hypothetical protein
VDKTGEASDREEEADQDEDRNNDEELPEPLRPAHPAVRAGTAPLLVLHLAKLEPRSGHGELPAIGQFGT